MTGQALYFTVKEVERMVMKLRKQFLEADFNHLPLVDGADKCEIAFGGSVTRAEVLEFAARLGYGAAEFAVHYKFGNLLVVTREDASSRPLVGANGLREEGGARTRLRVEAATEMFDGSGNGFEDETRVSVERTPVVC